MWAAGGKKEVHALCPERCLDDAVLSQLVELQVTEGFPGADHGDIWKGRNENAGEGLQAAQASRTVLTPAPMPPPCPLKPCRSVCLFREMGIKGQDGVWAHWYCSGE